MKFKLPKKEKNWFTKNLDAMGLSEKDKKFFERVTDFNDRSMLIAGFALGLCIGWLSLMPRSFINGTREFEHTVYAWDIPAFFALIVLVALLMYYMYRWNKLCREHLNEIPKEEVKI